MIDLLGFIYGLMKDLKEFLKWKEENKLVDMKWPAKSGFDEKWKEKGYELRWSKPEKIPSRQLDGWEVIYEVDKSKHVRRRIVLEDGLTLIGKPKTQA